MGPIDSSDNEHIQQLRGLIKDYLGSRPTHGTIAAIHDSTIDVSLGSTSTTLRTLPVSGGVNGLVAGDTVYLLYFGNQPVAINTRSFTGGVSSVGAAPHTHSTLYYTKAIIDGKLSAKSDIGHNHVFKELRADSGLIGGWKIDSTGIYENHSRLSGLGYISFGNTPSTNWGYPSWATDYGAWMGWDYGITDLAHVMTPIFANDPEGNVTVAGPKMAFYKNATNYLVWTGAKLLVKAANFTLDGSGNITASNVTLTGTITATAGSIGHWQIVSNKIRSVSGSVVMDADLETITLGAGITLDGVNQRILVGSANPRMLIDGAAKTMATNTFQAGVAGFQLNGISGNAEFNNVTSRGEFHASVFVISEQHAVGGSQIVLPAAALYADVTTQ